MPDGFDRSSAGALQIRVADVDDVDALVALVHAAYRGEPADSTWTTEADILGGQRVDRAMVREAIDDPSRTVLVAAERSGPRTDDGGGSIVACCELTGPDSAGTSVLGMFAVDPLRQGSGLGRRVLDAGESFAAERGASALELHVIDVRVELIDWYRRRGYVVTDERHPFPYGDERFGLPRRDDLQFAVLRKELTP